MTLARKRTKFVAIIISVLFLYNSFGYILLYLPAEMVIKHIVQKSLKEKKIKSEDLSILAFKISDLKNKKYDFEWESPGKEFRFNGKMYDIKDNLVRNDSIYYSCYYDEEENILDELFILNLKNSKKEATQNSVNIAFMFGLFFEDLKINYLETGNRNHSHIPLQKIERKTLNFIKDTPKPPPRIIIS